MGKFGRRSSAPPPQPPANAADGAARVRAAVMKLFDRQDGHGANWRLLAESVFRVAFEALDRLPADQKQALLKRLETGIYDRKVCNAPMDFIAGEPSADAGAGPVPSGPAYGPEHGK